MVEVSNLAFDTSVKSDGRNHHRICFDYKGRGYSLALTDPKFRVASIDNWQMPRAIIVVSIPSVPYGENDLYYKFVARVFNLIGQ